MAGLTEVDLADRPLASLVAMLVVALAVYVGLQLAVDGQVDLVESATFALVFAVAVVGVSVLRRRRSH